MDPQTTAIGLGLIISLFFTEIFGLSAGGMIVPGYLALQFHRPTDVAITLIVALVTYGIVLGISKFAIVYGRRRIVLMILFGFLLGHFVRALLAKTYVAEGSPAGMEAGLFCVIGFIVPGLIALWFDRQGPAQTLGTLLTTASVVRLALVVIGMEVMV